jgi:RNA polymerase-binding transcription factor DksA
MAKRKKKCKDCKQPIPVERLEALPETDYCIECADNHVEKKVGFMVYDGKTAPDIVFIDPQDEEKLRLAQRADRRER